VPAALSTAARVTGGEGGERNVAYTGAYADLSFCVAVANIISSDTRQIGDLYAEPGGTRDVLIYVHGFNQTFESAARDAARISDGIRFRGETMVFSWPSKGSIALPRLK
jgi:esterase/lipase superfamily enzyme